MKCRKIYEREKRAILCIAIGTAAISLSACSIADNVPIVQEIEANGGQLTGSKKDDIFSGESSEDVSLENLQFKTSSDMTDDGTVNLQDLKRLDCNSLLVGGDYGHGTIYEITEPESISRIINYFSKITGSEKEDSSDYYGTAYTLIFRKDTEIQELIYIYDDDAFGYGNTIKPEDYALDRYKMSTATEDVEKLVEEVIEEAGKKLEQTDTLDEDIIKFLEEREN